MRTNYKRARLFGIGATALSLCVGLVANDVAADAPRQADSAEKSYSSAPVQPLFDEIAGSSSIDTLFRGSDYAEWKTVSKSRISLNCGGRPILLKMAPSIGELHDADLGFSIGLISQRDKLNNRWQFRYLRDNNVQIAAFTLGHLSFAPQSELFLPLDLIAIDTPVSGHHVYTLQVKYIGEQIGGDMGDMRIQQARLVAIRL